MDSINVNLRASVDTSQAERQINGLVAHAKNIDIKLGGLDSRSFTQPLGRITGSVDEFRKSLDAANARVIAFSASAGVLFGLTKGFKEMVDATIKVEKTLTDINVILNTSTQNLEKFGDNLFEIAKKTGQTFSEVGAAATEFARQGLSMEQTLVRTRDALILVRLSGMDTQAAVSALTAAMNSFSNATLTSTEVINKMANVDASFAVSSRDLAEAISRVGSSAESVNVSFDELMGAVTAVQQTTARGGSVIGNSLKTIFARVQREDVVHQLKSLGVEVRDMEGNLRPTMVVLKELADTFKTLSPSVKAQTTELVGGVYQMNILKALLKDLGKEYSVFDQSVKISSESTSQATKRMDELNKSLSASLNSSVQTLTQLGKKVGELTLEPAIRRVLEGINSLSEESTKIKDIGALFGFDEKESSEFGGRVAKGILRGIGNFISGPGLLLVGGLMVKLLFDFGKFLSNATKDMMGMNNVAHEQAMVQQTIQSVLINNPKYIEQIIAKERTQLSIEQEISNVLKQRIIFLEKAASYSQSMAAGVMASGVVGKTDRSSGTVSLTNKTKSHGHIPREEQERMGAFRAGYKPGTVKQMNIPKEGRVTYNDAEKVKKFPFFEQPAIMPPIESEAGKIYKKQFEKAHNFNPYSPRWSSTMQNLSSIIGTTGGGRKKWGGFIPNFLRYVPPPPKEPQEESSRTSLQGVYSSLIGKEKSMDERLQLLGKTKRLGLTNEQIGAEAEGTFFETVERLRLSQYLQGHGFNKSQFDINDASSGVDINFSKADDQVKDAIRQYYKSTSKIDPAFADIMEAVEYKLTKSKKALAQARDQVKASGTTGKTAVYSRYREHQPRVDNGTFYATRLNRGFIPNFSEILPASFAELTNEQWEKLRAEQNIPPFLRNAIHLGGGAGGNVYKYQLPSGKWKTAKKLHSGDKGSADLAKKTKEATKKLSSFYREKALLDETVTADKSAVNFYGAYGDYKRTRTSLKKDNPNLSQGEIDKLSLIEQMQSESPGSLGGDLTRSLIVDIIHKATGKDEAAIRTDYWSSISGDNQKSKMFLDAVEEAKKEKLKLIERVKNEKMSVSFGKFSRGMRYLGGNPKFEETRVANLNAASSDKYPGWIFKDYAGFGKEEEGVARLTRQQASGLIDAADKYGVADQFKGIKESYIRKNQKTGGKEVVAIDPFLGYNRGLVPNFHPFANASATGRKELHDFDETLAHYSKDTDPKDLFFADSVLKGKPTPLAGQLKGQTVTVLTARDQSSSKNIEEKLKSWGINVDKVLTTASYFNDLKIASDGSGKIIRNPSRGGRVNGFRNLSAAEKKALLIQRIHGKYGGKYHLIDDAVKNIDAIKAMGNPDISGELYSFEGQVAGMGSSFNSGGFVPNFSAAAALWGARSGQNTSSTDVKSLVEKFPYLTRHISNFNNAEKSKRIHDTDKITIPNIKIDYFKNEEIDKQLAKKKRGAKAVTDATKEIENIIIEAKGAERTQQNSALDLDKESLIAEIKSGRYSPEDVKNKFFRYAIEKPGVHFKDFSKDPYDDIILRKKVTPKLIIAKTRKEIEEMEKRPALVGASSGFIPNFSDANPSIGDNYSKHRNVIWNGKNWMMGQTKMYPDKHDWSGPGPTLGSRSRDGKSVWNGWFWEPVGKSGGFIPNFMFSGRAAQNREHGEDFRRELKTYSPQEKRRYYADEAKRKRELAERRAAESKRLAEESILNYVQTLRDLRAKGEDHRPPASRKIDDIWLKNNGYDPVTLMKNKAGGFIPNFFLDRGRSFKEREQSSGLGPKHEYMSEKEKREYYRAEQERKERAYKYKQEEMIRKHAEQEKALKLWREEEARKHPELYPPKTPEQLAADKAWKEKMRKQYGGSARGFIPNFSSNVQKALDTERALGGDPVLDYDKRVGTYVRDGRTQRNFSDVLRDHPEGLQKAIKNSKKVQDKTAATGFVPNFEPATGFESAVLMGSFSALSYAMVNLVNEIRNSSKEFKKLEREVSKNQRTYKNSRDDYSASLKEGQNARQSLSRIKKQDPTRVEPAAIQERIKNSSAALKTAQEEEAKLREKQKSGTALDQGEKEKLNQLKAEQKKQKQAFQQATQDQARLDRVAQASQTTGDLRQQVQSGRATQKEDIQRANLHNQQLGLFGNPIHVRQGRKQLTANAPGGFRRAANSLSNNSGQIAMALPMLSSIGAQMWAGDDEKKQIRGETWSTAIMTGSILTGIGSALGGAIGGLLGTAAAPGAGTAAGAAWGAGLGATAGTALGGYLGFQTEKDKLRKLETKKLNEEARKIEESLTSTSNQRQAFFSAQEKLNSLILENAKPEIIIKAKREMEKALLGNKSFIGTEKAFEEYSQDQKKKASALGVQSMGKELGALTVGSKDSIIKSNDIMDVLRENMSLDKIKGLDTSKLESMSLNKENFEQVGQMLGIDSSIISGLLQSVDGDVKKLELIFSGMQEAGSLAVKNLKESEKLAAISAEKTNRAKEFAKKEKDLNISMDELNIALNMQRENFEKVAKAIHKIKMSREDFKIDLKLKAAELEIGHQNPFLSESRKQTLTAELERQQRSSGYHRERRGLIEEASFNLSKESQDLFNKLFQDIRAFVPKDISGGSPLDTAEKNEQSALRKVFDTLQKEQKVFFQNALLNPLEFESSLDQFLRKIDEISTGSGEMTRATEILIENFRNSALKIKVHTEAEMAILVDKQVLEERLHQLREQYAAETINLNNKLRTLGGAADFLTKGLGSLGGKSNDLKKFFDQRMSEKVYQPSYETKPSLFSPDPQMEKGRSFLMFIKTLADDYPSVDMKSIKGTDAYMNTIAAMAKSMEQQLSAFVSMAGDMATDDLLKQLAKIDFKELAKLGVDSTAKIEQEMLQALREMEMEMGLIEPSVTASGATIASSINSASSKTESTISSILGEVKGAISKVGSALEHDNSEIIGNAVALSMSKELYDSPLAISLSSLDIELNSTLQELNSTLQDLNKERETKNKLDDISNFMSANTGLFDEKSQKAILAAGTPEKKQELIRDRLNAYSKEHGPGSIDPTATDWWKRISRDEKETKTEIIEAKDLPKGSQEERNYKELQRGAELLQKFSPEDFIERERVRQASRGYSDESSKTADLSLKERREDHEVLYNNYINTLQTNNIKKGDFKKYTPELIDMFSGLQLSLVKIAALKEEVSKGFIPSIGALQADKEKYLAERKMEYTGQVSARHKRFQEALLDVNPNQLRRKVSTESFTPIPQATLDKEAEDKAAKERERQAQKDAKAAQHASQKGEHQKRIEAAARDLAEAQRRRALSLDGRPIYGPLTEEEARKQGSQANVPFTPNQYSPNQLLEYSRKRREEAQARKAKREQSRAPKPPTKEQLEEERKRLEKLEQDRANKMFDFYDDFETNKYSDTVGNIIGSRRLSSKAALADEYYKQEELKFRETSERNFGVLEGSPEYFKKLTEAFKAGMEKTRIGKALENTVNTNRLTTEAIIELAKAGDYGDKTKAFDKQLEQFAAEMTERLEGGEAPMSRLEQLMNKGYEMVGWKPTSPQKIPGLYEEKFKDQKHKLTDNPLEVFQAILSDPKFMDIFKNALTAQDNRAKEQMKTMYKDIGFLSVLTGKYHKDSLSSLEKVKDILNNIENLNEQHVFLLKSLNGLTRVAKAADSKRKADRLRLQTGEFDDQTERLDAEDQELEDSQQLLLRGGTKFNWKKLFNFENPFEKNKGLLQQFKESGGNSLSDFLSRNKDFQQGITTWRQKRLEREKSEQEKALIRTDYQSALQRSREGGGYFDPKEVEAVNATIQTLLTAQTLSTKELTEALKARSDAEIGQTRRNIEADNANPYLSTEDRMINKNTLISQLIKRNEYEITDSIKNIGASWRYGLMEMNTDLHLTLTQIGEQFRSGVSGAFFEFIKGTKDLKTAFKDLFQSIADMALKAALDMALKRYLFDPLGQLMGGNSGGLVSQNGIQKFARGGMVSGGSGTKDDVPALLNNGEYVIRKSSVEKYGPNFFEKLNAKKYSHGGDVHTKDPQADLTSSLETFQDQKESFASFDLRNAFVYDDDKYPTLAGSKYDIDSRLSRRALTDDNNKRNEIRKDKKETLDDYLHDREQDLEEYRKELIEFKKQSKSRLLKTLAFLGITTALGGLFPTPGDKSFSEILNKTGRAKGGIINGQDNIPALLMGGEYVLNKEAVDKYGIGALNDLNKGLIDIPRFAEGGYVGRNGSRGNSVDSGSGLAGEMVNNISINVNITNDKTSTTTTSSGVDETQARGLSEMIKNQVVQTIIQQKRQGGILYDKNISGT